MRRKFSLVNMVQNVLKPRYNDLETDEKVKMDMKIKKDKMNPSNPSSALITGYNTTKIDQIITSLKEQHFDNFTKNELLSFREQILKNVKFCLTGIYKKIEFEKITIEIEKTMELIQETEILTGFDVKKIKEVYNFEEFQNVLKKKEFILNSLEYYMENIDRILDVDFVPISKDILKSTNEETQINEIPLSEKHFFSILDIHKRDNLNEIQTALSLYTKQEGKTRFLIYTMDSMIFLDEIETKKLIDHFKSLTAYLSIDVLLLFSNIEKFQTEFSLKKNKQTIKQKDVKTYFSEKRKFFKKLISPKLKCVFIMIDDEKDERLKNGILDFLNGLVVESLVKSSSFYDF